MRTTLAFIVLLSGCATTTSEIREETTATPAPPTMNCQLNLPIISWLPTNAHNAFGSLRNDSVTGSPYHEGIDFISRNPVVRTVRKGKLDVYITKKGKGQHLTCLSIIVSEEQGIADIYCGFETRVPMKILQEVKKGDVLGTALPVSRNFFTIHYGISDLREVGDGLVETFRDPTTTLLQANGCQ